MKMKNMTLIGLLMVASKFTLTLLSDHGSLPLGTACPFQREQHCRSRNTAFHL